MLAFALITLLIMAETGHRGGQINHPEIRLPTDILPTDDKAGLTPAIELLINNVIWFVPWQTIHFFGFSLIFATVLFVTLRVLGVAKSIPFSAVHRVMPLGWLGVVMNVFSGMLMLLAELVPLPQRNHLRAEDRVHRDRRHRRAVLLGLRPDLVRQGGRGRAGELEGSRDPRSGGVVRRDHRRPPAALCVMWKG